eukprot:CAMPEP_0205831230 /NCGR_PEP_ID=MMETSP0206-20130828/43470_1 /ASSEMBLY_ACC=CAM_ASM_000279 /TAXON_ID=36767 /ORGANISM="Euplotes focardii, Strain TN1" /LENGTH=177 /DNA_ID=CAMNT_0053135673 /DNA_START=70 /DNA_END=599 /DNA_ORIENTATION=+
MNPISREELRNNRRKAQGSHNIFGGYDAPDRFSARPKPAKKEAAPKLRGQDRRAPWPGQDGPALRVSRNAVQSEADRNKSQQRGSNLFGGWGFSEADRFNREGPPPSKGPKRVDKAPQEPNLSKGDGRAPHSANLGLVIGHQGDAESPGLHGKTGANRDSLDSWVTGSMGRSPISKG